MKLAYEKWSGNHKQLPLFRYPHYCGETVATLPYDAETGKCHKCNGDLFLTDMLGFHQEADWIQHRILLQQII